MQEYAGARNRERLLSLLMPVQRAAEHCPWLKAIVDGGEIYHPLRLNPQQTLQFLRDVPALEGAGVVVRMPATWRMNRPARPQVTATVGSHSPSQLGMDALLDFRMDVTLDGESLTRAEIKRLLAHTDGLALIRGKWVEVDRERLSRTLEQFEAIEHRAVSDGLSFGEAMRMLAGASIADGEAAGQSDVAWSETVAGPWLAETLRSLRHPGGLARVDPGRSFQGTLRPYQLAGVQWLHLLARLRLGACLADDMGLGKTIQVFSLLLVLKNWAAEKRSRPCSSRPPRCSATGPTSSRGSRRASQVSSPIHRQCPRRNWRSRHRRSRRCATSSSRATARSRARRGSSDVMGLAILDEAQAIKNPGAKQTRAVKSSRPRRASR